MTSEEANNLFKQNYKDENRAWLDMEDAEAQLKEAEATALLGPQEGTVPEKQARVLLATTKEAKAYRTAEFNYKNCLAERKAAYNMFLILHKQSGEPIIMDTHGN